MVQPIGPCGPCAPGSMPPNPFGGPASSPMGFGVGGAPGTIFGEVGVIPTPDVPVVPRRGPAPVILGAAGLYKILAETAITNVPTSQVIGDMGLSPNAAASITGFALVLDGSGEFSTSAQVTGRVFAADYAPPTPANLTAAVLAMMAAYTDASLRIPDYVELNAGNIGGLTLTPATYKWTSNVTVASNLTFNGGPDDTWILQIDGTLMVGPGVQIILVGGAQPRNIIWQVAGATTINPGAAFMGNILDQTSIAVQTGASVIGRLLAQSAVTLDNNFINGI